MGYKIERKEVEFDECFPEDAAQYYDIANNFLNLNIENYAAAYEMSQKAWVLADRWSCIAANAAKLATMKKVSKTDLYNYCYQKYRQLQYMHEFCRMMYRQGVESLREKREGL